MVSQVDNFANIGKAVLLQSLGLQKNYSEEIESTIDVTDYDKPACTSCKYHSIINSFSPDSEAYKSALARCNSCPYRSTTTKTIHKKVYHNELNRYGYKPMLKSVAIKLLLLLHFYHPDQFGVVSQLSFDDCAMQLNCSTRTIYNNLNILASFGYISFSKNNAHYFSVCLNDYESYYLPASQGGRGYIVMSSELLKQVISIDNLMSLRIHLRELVELDTLNLKGPFTAVNKTFKEMKLSLPSYCKPCIIKSCVKHETGIFNITFKESSVRFEILDRFDSKKQKSMLYDTYILMFNDFLHSFNSSVIRVNTENYIPSEFRDFFTPELSEDKNFCLMHVKDFEIEDLAQLSMQYSFNNVVSALSSVYRDYILKEKAVNNLGALLRTIIISNINKRCLHHGNAA